MVRREFEPPAAVRRDQLLFIKISAEHAKDSAGLGHKAIGCTRAEVFETIFGEETETDLFGEQAVLCGGTSELIRADSRHLCEPATRRELAYFECLHELKFIVDLIHESGIAGMRALISDAAAWGELTVGPHLIDPAVKKTNGKWLCARSALENSRRIHSRDENWPASLQKGCTRLDKHPIEQVGRRLRALMTGRKKLNEVNRSSSRQLPAFLNAYYLSIRSLGKLPRIIIGLGVVGTRA